MMGIGGIGMSALARYFLYKKIEVLGYDKTQSKITNELQREGAKLVFNEDFDFFCDTVGIPRVTLPHKNSFDHRAYRDYYSDETIDLLLNLEDFKKDLDYLGYDHKP